MSLLTALLLPLAAEATPTLGEDHFEQSYNYDAYSLGSGRIHFKTLIFAEGWWDNYCANRGRYTGLSDWGDYPNIWYQTSGGSQIHIIEYYADDYNNKPGGVSGRPRDKGWVTVRVPSSTTGVIVVTNTYDGAQYTVPADGNWHELDIRRADAGDHLTFLEFDWYTPDTLMGISFTAGVYSSRLSENEWQDDWEDDTFNLGTFSGGNMDQQPLLMDPLFYPSSEVAAGYIAVPYVSYQETYQYNTSLNPTLNIPCHSRSDIIYAPSADSVQHGFYINMQTRQSATAGTEIELKQWLKSSKQNIPAYHRIYNMQVKPYTYQVDSSGLWLQDQRARDITWQIRFPYENDAVMFDYFELQRAYSPDFSDATTIATIEMDWSSRDSAEWQTYRYIDSTRGAWMNPRYPITNDSCFLVFYRVRRMSAATWGWEANPYVDSASNLQRLYLQSFYGVGPIPSRYYHADDQFQSNHRVLFELTLPNNNENHAGTQEDPRIVRTYWDSDATMFLERIAIETHDTVRLRVPADSIEAAIRRMSIDPSANPRANYTIRFTDQVYLNCVHYKYRVYIDTVGATLKMKHNNNENEPVTSASAWAFGLQGAEPYFTNAASLDNLTASQGEYADCILLAWDATDGAVDEYIIERASSRNGYFYPQGRTTLGYWRDSTASPNVSTWYYQVTAAYTCNGVRTEDTRSVTGSRSPWGRVSGRILYADGTGCAGVTVTATRTSDNTVVQTVHTDASGAYLFDSLPYAAGFEYAITPTAQSAEFRYNHTSSTFASINLSLSHCVLTDIDFENISSVRFSGRVLYENSTIPVRDANLKLNGTLVSMDQSPVRTTAAGNFEIRVPQGEAFTLQVVKEGHTFAGDGFVRIGGDSLLTLTGVVS